MSATDLAALLLQRAPVPALGVQLRELHAREASGSGAAGRPSRRSPDAMRRYRSRFADAAADEAARVPSREEGADAESAAASAADKVFEVIDAEQSRAISIRQLLLAFSSPSAELRAALEEAGLEVIQGSA